MFSFYFERYINCKKVNIFWTVYKCSDCTETCHRKFEKKFIQTEQILISTVDILPATSLIPYATEFEKVMNGMESIKQYCKEGFATLEPSVYLKYVYL